MHYFASVLIGGLLNLVGSFVGRVLLVLGLSYVTYTGFDVMIGWLLDSIKSSMSSLPGEVLSFIAWLWVDKAISMVFSAYTAAAGLRMMGSTSVTKLVRK